MIFIFFLATIILGITPQKAYEIEKQVEKEGGLRFKSIPEVVLLGSEDFSKLLKKDEMKEAAILKALGIIDNEEKYAQIKRHLMSSTAVGFFNPEDPSKVYIMKNRGKLEQEFALVHELRHCLQYQNFPWVFKPLKKGLFIEDRVLSTVAILEGDANLITFRHYGIKDFPMDFSLLKLPESKSGEFLKGIFSFIYREGYVAVRNFYRENGWEAVKKILASPPKHTAYFFSRPYKEIKCECKSPITLGMEIYSFPLGKVSKKMVGDCLCQNGKFLQVKLDFSDEESANSADSILHKKMHNKLKIIQKDKTIEIRTEVKNDSSYPGKKRDDAKN